MLELCSCQHRVSLKNCNKGFLILGSGTVPGVGCFMIDNPLRTHSRYIPIGILGFLKFVSLTLPKSWYRSAHVVVFSYHSAEMWSSVTKSVIQSSNYQCAVS
jgi:hypothetical protein